MIKFFRHIRKKLLSENKFSKYLIYALGEIVLVVIGILIALQINNLNENRKSAENEAHILNEVLNNLKEDAQQIDFILQRRKNSQTAVANLITILNSPSFDTSEIEQEIAQFLTFERYYPHNNAFEMMKSNGLIIKNKNLRVYLSRYYDFEQKKVAQSIKDIENVFIRLVSTENAIRSNLSTAKMGTKNTSSLKLLKPLDSDFITLLKTELITFNDNNGTAIDRIEEFYNANKQLISLVNGELDTSRLKKHLNLEHD